MFRATNEAIPSAMVLPSNEMGSWFYKHSGKTYGPVPESFLQRMARDGRIGPTDEIRQEGSSSWTSAGQVSVFFEPVAEETSPATEPSPPTRPEDVEPEPLPPLRAEAPTPPAVNENWPAATRRTLIGSLITAAVILVGSTGWWLATRDTWEIENRSRIEAASGQVVALTQGRNFPQALQANGQLTNLIGNRIIQDPSLRQKLARAASSAELAKRAVEMDRLRGSVSPRSFAKVRCPRCGGTGRISGQESPPEPSGAGRSDRPDTRCPQCGGSGTVVERR